MSVERVMRATQAENLRRTGQVISQANSPTNAMQSAVLYHDAFDRNNATSKQTAAIR
jgi:hypothetical protein